MEGHSSYWFGSRDCGMGRLPERENLEIFGDGAFIHWLESRTAKSRA